MPPSKIHHLSNQLTVLTIVKWEAFLLQSLFLRRMKQYSDWDVKETINKWSFFLFYAKIPIKSEKITPKTWYIYLVYKVEPFFSKQNSIAYNFFFFWFNTNNFRFLRKMLQNILNEVNFSKCFTKNNNSFKKKRSYTKKIDKKNPSCFFAVFFLMCTL